jgi:hypothetical protein
MNVEGMQELSLQLFHIDEVEHIWLILIRASVRSNFHICVKPLQI